MYLHLLITAFEGHRHQLEALCELERNFVFHYWILSFYEINYIRYVRAYC